MPDITVENLTVNYAANKKNVTLALDNVSVKFYSNKINVIAGSSGCGKTTLLKTIAGLIKESSGNIYFDNINARQLTIQERNLSYVSQNYVLFPHKTIYDNIAFPLKIMGAPREEVDARVIEIAKSLDLTACLTRKPKHISGGQQQRAALARALVKRPSACLMDEPLSNLDPELRGEARKLIKSVFDKYGMTVIYVTHDFREALALADNLVIMDGGQVAVSGNPAAVCASGNAVVRGLIEGSKADFSEFAKNYDLDDIEIDEDYLIECASEILDVFVDKLSEDEIDYKLFTMIS